MFPVATRGDMLMGASPSFIVGPCEPNILVNGQNAAKVGDATTPHPHGLVIVVGFLTPVVPTNVLFNGTPARTLGDFATCGDVISLCKNVNVLVK